MPPGGRMPAGTAGAPGAAPGMPPGICCGMAAGGCCCMGCMPGCCWCIAGGGPPFACGAAPMGRGPPGMPADGNTNITSHTAVSM